MNFESLKKHFSRSRLSFWEARGGLIHAQRDWLVMFSLFVVVLIGVTFFSVYLFLEINKGDLYVVSASSTVRVETINRSLLNETLATLEERALRFSGLTERPPAIPSP